MQTVNVIEINDRGSVASLRAFAEAIPAETLFVELVKSQTDHTDSEIEQCLDEGHVEVPGGGSIQLVWSS